MALPRADAGVFVFAAPTQVIVAGETVSADDPRALEAMSTAAAKLREHGLDELAAELEARAGAPAAAAPAATGGEVARRARRRRRRDAERGRTAVPRAAGRAGRRSRRGAGCAGPARAAGAALLRLPDRRQASWARSLSLPVTLNGLARVQEV